MTKGFSKDDSLPNMPRKGVAQYLGQDGDDS
jgi:hypothetical protein